ncbi:hypothetical protein Plhal304r1_c006g0025361 [Plasmopara halstedii]
MPSSRYFEDTRRRKRMSKYWRSRVGMLLVGICLILTAMNEILDVWKTSCRIRSKMRTPFHLLSNYQKKRLKKKCKRSKWWPFSW